MNYKAYLIKRKLEDIVIYPFILLGRVIAYLNPLKKEYDVFFFFPFYHTGGAEKVHALVAQATGNSNSIIYFTRKSVDTTFYKDFVLSGCTIKDISKYVDNKFLYFLNLIFRGIISGYINAQKKSTLVFNGQSNFGYKISPWIKPSIPQVELIHSFNTFSWIRIPFLPFITQTVIISKVRLEQHLEQYKKLNIPPSFSNKIQHIVNGIPLPEQVSKKDFTGRLQVLYVGRGTEEKRVHIIAEMAKVSSDNQLLVDFIFLGDVQAAIPPSRVSFCNLVGQIDDKKEIEKYYQQAHIVIITSYTEGFPLVIEEGMARGCAVLATPVGDIPVHVKNGENGFLFTTVSDEEKIVKEGIEFLTSLIQNKNFLISMEERNKEYAKDIFSIEKFEQSYKNLFTQLRNSQIEAS